MWLIKWYDTILEYIFGEYLTYHNGELSYYIILSIKIPMTGIILN